MDLEHKAIMRLQEAARLSEFYYHDALLVSYSGGKDSDVVLELCRRAGIPFSVIHNLTTADAPETFYHIRKVFHRLELDNVPCAINKPTYKGQSISMWTLIPQKMIPPSRSIRYCCSIMKERNGTNRCVVLSVRKYESAGRADSAVAEIQGKTRNGKATFDFDNGDERIIAPCQMKATIRIHPIVDWTDRDIWQFLRDTKVDMNPCYAMGFKRVGCVGCPMAGKIATRNSVNGPSLRTYIGKPLAAWWRPAGPSARMAPGGMPTRCSAGGWRIRTWTGSWTSSAGRWGLMSLEIVPMTLKKANAFVAEHHRHHHGPVTGHKFSIGCSDGEKIVGVAIVGRPVSRYLDDGWTLEVNRLCTDGARNACSMLYASAWRVARALGYKRLVTYIMESESGASLRAAGWRCVGQAGGLQWTGKRRPEVDLYPRQMKLRFEQKRE